MTKAIPELLTEKLRADDVIVEIKRPGHLMPRPLKTQSKADVYSHSFPVTNL